MSPDHVDSPLPPQEHLRQLQQVYGPLSPAFVAEELHCTLEQATRHLYGPQADQYCWVSLADLAELAEVSPVGLKRWVRRYHLQSAPQRGQGRKASLSIHLDDARSFLRGQLHMMPGKEGPTADALPRVTASDLSPARLPGLFSTATVVDVDWQLARQAAWPMTVERLAEAVYGSRAETAQQQIRSLLRVWEAQGRVVCFARGLYDVVRPVLVLDPGRYGRSTLPGDELQKLRAHHPEIAHWPSGPLAAAWRAYSSFYVGTLLPVMDRGEPTFLEYLLVRQLNPDGVPGAVDGRYEELCREAAFSRLVPASPGRAPEPQQPELTVSNIEAGLIDFKAAAEATRLKMQRKLKKGQAPNRGRGTTVSGSMQEGL
ncbi:hypothetical protein [Deinococcus humi]|uniref:Helix-turn-helix domain-containing protein n=1 Tax=Deinococcus humi TaxID=662880 RepID=A0A7W8JUY6_9DEIO|nr:hypothetical protein [Deinococcus humi]MBB5363710.1 hypothetical protein [Deinococcus humi]GGO29667.1 hypothetical protein GCM10008949_23500 [Deinococcus humi]